MEGLRLSIKEAKKELADTLKLPGEIEKQSPIEMEEIKELEKKLKKYIEKGESILKQKFTTI